MFRQELPGGRKNIRCEYCYRDCPNDGPCRLDEKPEIDEGVPK